MDLTPKLSAAKGVTLILWSMNFSLHVRVFVYYAKLIIESKNVPLKSRAL
jgi:hypothetical protein